MNELELRACLTKHPLTRRFFQGVFARDELVNKELDPNTLYIINTDKRKSSGQHWVLVYRGNGEPFYFDSYGEPPMFPEIAAFLYPYYTFNKKQLQGLTSFVCGHYCAYVASQLCAGETIETIRRRFSRNHDRNDKIIVTLFRKEFRFYKNPNAPMGCQCKHGSH